MTTTSAPKVHKAKAAFDFSQISEWLKQHSHEYVGKWVVLAGGRLIGAGDDPLPIVRQARAQGIKAPFVEFVRDDSEPFLGGWL